MRYKIRILVHALWMSAVFLQCKKPGSEESSPTIGIIKIGCDHQIKDLMIQQEQIFEQRYKYADVQLEFFNERELVNLWIADSFRNVVMGRALDSFEMDFFIKNKQVRPRHFPFAVGAITLLTYKSNSDSTILFEEFIDWIKGIKSGRHGYQTLVVEDANSGLSHYLLDLIREEQFKGSVYALKDKSSILEYLKNNPSALAIVDWAEFSDSDDSQRRSLLKDFRRIAISRPKDSVQFGFLFPDQYNLQDKRYPLQRTWQFISSSGKSDLALGFASFVTGEIGQKIILKAGLLPIYQTERWIEFQAGDIKVVN
ncbi:MAG: substrate-binding domain-containing protein [Saprospiraceae bacterium]|nr:substrate-binding domain-containing protein [Saprospiraceae bacterium]